MGLCSTSDQSDISLHPKNDLFQVSRDRSPIRSVRDSFRDFFPSVRSGRDEWATGPRVMTNKRSTIASMIISDIHSANKKLNCGIMKNSIKDAKENIIAEKMDVFVKNNGMISIRGMNAFVTLDRGLRVQFSKDLVSVKILLGPPLEFIAPRVEEQPPPQQLEDKGNDLNCVRRRSNNSLKISFTEYSCNCPKRS